MYMIDHYQGSMDRLNREMIESLEELTETLLDLPKVDNMPDWVKEVIRHRLNREIHWSFERIVANTHLEPIIDVQTHLRNVKLEMTSLRTKYDRIWLKSTYRLYELEYGEFSHARTSEAKTLYERCCYLALERWIHDESRICPVGP